MVSVRDEKLKIAVPNSDKIWEIDLKDEGTRWQQQRAGFFKKVPSLQVKYRGEKKRKTITLFCKNKRQVRSSLCRAVVVSISLLRGCTCIRFVSFCNRVFVINRALR